MQGQPSAEGAIELGCGTHPDFRNHGYAIEAAGAVLRWASEQPPGKHVIAHGD